VQNVADDAVEAGVVGEAAVPAVVSEHEERPEHGALRRPVQRPDEPAVLSIIKNQKEFFSAGSLMQQGAGSLYFSLLSLFTSPKTKNNDQVDTGRTLNTVTKRLLHANNAGV
jgi:hypothetical protein